MDKVLVFCILLLKFGLFTAAPQSSCKILGIENNGSPAYYTIKEPITTAHKGIIATFNTSNIKEIISQNSEYLEASLDSNILNIYTSKNYDNFKFEFKDSYVYGSGIEIEILFKCIDTNGLKHTNTYIIKQEVVTPRTDSIDSDKNGLAFSQEKYEYTFGMPIPQDCELTKLQPITVSTNTKSSSKSDLYFLLEFNEYFRVSYYGERTKDMKYSTNLEALQEIKPPFQKTFQIYAMQNGKKVPERNGSALVTINIYDHVKPPLSDLPETSSHPPVFSKYLYYGNYTESNDLYMDEVITFKYGAQDDTIITQSDYEDYINVELDKTNVNLINVQIKKSLPGNLLNSLDMIVIEIKAINKNINIAGRTSLLIRLPKGKPTLISVHGENNFTYSNTPVILLTTGMMFIIFLNIIIVTWHFYKKKLNK